jgi:hypothetical protein
VHRDEQPGAAVGDDLGEGADPPRSIAFSAPDRIDVTVQRIRTARTERYRLEIGKVELEGRWICLRRQFIKLGDAAEEI